MCGEQAGEAEAMIIELKAADEARLMIAQAKEQAVLQMRETALRGEVTNTIPNNHNCRVC